MTDSRPTVLVTGVSGNLGRRLLQQLTDVNVIGADLTPPSTNQPVRFVSMDLEHENCCRELMLLFREHRIDTVIHLAFVMDSVRAGISDPKRVWQVNVAGTARVMEAIAEANREEVLVGKFLFPSSAWVYGTGLSASVGEDSPLEAHTLPYAVQQAEAEKVIRHRSPGMRGCSVYVLRSAMFAGAGVESYFVDALRGVANGPAGRAMRMRRAGKRLPFPQPVGNSSSENQIQFMHVEDMARLVAHIARKREPETQRITILNAAGLGEPLSYARCIEMTQTKALRLPGDWAIEMLLRYWFSRKISRMPPEMTPYLSSSCVLSIERLREFLGQNFDKVIRHTTVDAFADSLEPASASSARSAAS
jgi:nucleoside-diphosphate-sugar epimerase